EEIYSVELGNVLGRLLPSELAHLGQPTEVLLIERIAERKALQYAVRGEEQARRGPLVIALDESGSMHGYRNEWSKAAAVALARVALADGRSAAVVHYSTSCQVTYLKPGDDQAVFALITHFLSGGTSIARALLRSAEEVSKMERKGERGADVVLVTDGCDSNYSAQEDAIEKIKSLGSKLWTVMIQCSVDESSAIRKLAHKYVELEVGNLVNGDVLALQGVVNPA
ncbi:MAG: VWA domain-containing protein, partial [Syntrophorhabdaceae bacterium]|nr:VWA domain-containing protein [Syntrophorhabdaceae bacterium]